MKPISMVPWQAHVLREQPSRHLRLLADFVRDGRIREPVDEFIRIPLLQFF